MAGKKDIKDLEDIKILVDDFYDRVREDDLLAPIFNFRLSVYWQPHLEKMYSFWNAALFGVKGYNGNPFMKHMTMELGPEHYERWLSMFDDTINTHFEGPVADDARRRAMIMAAMFRSKTERLKQDKIRPVV